MAQKKARIGRPPLPKGTSKSEMLRVKATPSEVALIDTVAARHGVGRSEVIRRAIYVVAMQPDLIKHTFISKEVHAKVMATVLKNPPRHVPRLDIEMPKPGVEPGRYWQIKGKNKMKTKELEQLQQEWAERNNTTVAEGEQTFREWKRLDEWTNANALRDVLKDQDSMEGLGADEG